MKKLILTLGIALAGISFGYSQSTATPAPATGDKLVAKMKGVCNLTPEQITKIQPAAATFAKTRQANKSKYASDPAGMKTANKAAMDAFTAQIKPVLSAEQMEQFQGYVKKQMAAKASGGGDKDKE